MDTAFLSEKFIISLSTAFFTVLYVLTARLLLLRAKKRRKDRQRRLLKTISVGLSNGTLTTIDDFVNVYKGIYGLEGEDINFKAGLANRLREFLVHLISSGNYDSDQVTTIKGKVTEIIDTIEAGNPHSSLPTAERNLIIDAQKFITHNDNTSAIEKLNNLAGLIEVRQDSLNRAQASNKWSIPLAVIGLVLTVIFGVISLFK
jgi:hypothetical protein